MDDNRKWEIVLNLFTILGVALRAMPDAKRIYDQTVEALKGGLTDEEWAKMQSERDELIARILKGTA